MASTLDIARRHFQNQNTYRSGEMHGLVTSYDPKNHLAKVTLMPFGYETGWLPIHTSHIGETYGIAQGLQTGSGMGGQGGDSSGGGSSGGDSQGAGSGLQGDQVIVSYQEDDGDGGKIIGRIHSTQDKPLQVQSGEWARWNVFKKDSDAGPDSAQSGQQNNTGQKIFHKNDGGQYLEDGAGASSFRDGKGNTTHNSIGTHKTQIIQQRDGSPFDSLSGNQSSSSSPQQIHHTTYDKNKGVTTGAFQDQHKTTWDQGGVTHTSSSTVTSKAPSIPHQGNTSVTQNLTVAQTITAQTYDTSSDRRLKSEIVDLTGTLDKVLALKVKSFNKKSLEIDADGSCSISADPATPTIGLIAQEAEEIFPDVVGTITGSDFLAVQESKVCMYLLSAFQEYVAKTDKKIADLEAKLQGQ